MQARRKIEPSSRRTFALSVASGVLLLLPAAARPPILRAQAQPTATAIREFVDETGRRAAVPQPVRRIVSLAPSLTETVYALGAQDRLVGVTDYCDYPPEAKSKPKVGGAINPNLEQVVALKPDVVLVTRSLNRLETVESLDRLSIPVYATDPRSVEGVLTSTRRLAEVIGAGEQGETLLASLRARLDELKRRLDALPPRRVLFVVWPDPLISVGRGTFLADALRWAGAESVVDSTQDWPRLSLEEVVRLQPDDLVFASAHAEAAERDFQALRERPGWRSLGAVRQKHIAVISDAVNRPAPRLVDAILELARQLHPEAFRPAPGNRNSKSGIWPAGKSGIADAREVRPCGR